MPGPAPKPENERRTRHKAMVPGMTYLPSGGRQGPVPAWPLGEHTEAEWDIWVDLWKLPHAVAWERFGYERTVARYVRTLTVVEKRDPAASMLAAATALEDRLGLTPMAAARLRWQITDDEVGEKREVKGKTAKPKHRLKAVDPDAVAGA